jgi:hypothetical protein
MIKGDVIQAYLRYNIVDIQKQLMDTVSLIKELCGKRRSVILYIASIK